MNDCAQSPRRLFLSWDAPACCLVAAELLRRGPIDPTKPMLVVVPTREAARLLREQLAIQSAQSEGEGACLSPRIIPMNQLVVSPPQHRSPNSSQELALWVAFLQNQAKHFGTLFPNWAQWAPESVILAAEQQQRLFHEMAQQGLDAHHPLWHEAAALDSRWLALQKLQLLYRHHLAQWDYHDPNEGGLCCAPAGTCIILAATPNLSLAAQQVLTQGDYEVELWLHARPEHDAAFDAWGRPNRAWLNEASAEELRMNKADWQRHFCLAGDVWKMNELATKRAAIINGANWRNPLHAVALGVCDADIEPSMEDELAAKDCEVYRPRGIPFTASGWLLLLKQLRRLMIQLDLSSTPISEPQYFPTAPLIALFKMPLLLCLFVPEEDVQPLLELLDEVQFTSIPERMNTLFHELARHEKRGSQTARPLRLSLEQLASWLQGLMSSSQSLLRGLNQLVQTQSRAPRTAMSELDWALHRQFSEQLLDVIESLEEQAVFYEELRPLSLLAMMERLCLGITAQGPRGECALSLLGWLELAFSPARNLVICGLHDGVVPERWQVDCTLTPPIRECLQLPQDEDQAARDAYLLRSMIACRKGDVDFFFSKTNSKRDPLAPCSLFMRLCPMDKLAILTEFFFAEHDDCPVTSSEIYEETGWDFQKFYSRKRSPENLGMLSLDQLDTPQHNPLAQRAFSPSLLKGFLTCPQSFWIEHVFRLDTNTYVEEKKNLSSAELGTCLHKVMEDFARLYPSYADFRAAYPELPEQASRQDEASLQAFTTRIHALFDEVYHDFYGDNKLLPQQLQELGMKKRLSDYASVHLELWQEGWEVARDESGTLMLEYCPQWTWRGYPMRVKIDRIDTRLYEGKREYLVLDYKTGGDIENCQREHLRELAERHVPKLHSCVSAKLDACVLKKTEKKTTWGRWINLQLPFYVAWLQDHYPNAEHRCGYLYLSQKKGATRAIIWPKEEMDSLFPNAHLWMECVMELIRQGRCLVKAEHLGWGKSKYKLFTDLMTHAEWLITR